MRGRVGAGALAAVFRDTRAAALGTAAAIGLCASACLGIVYIDHQRSVAKQAAAAAREERANADLQDALAQLRDQVGATSQALKLAQAQIAALSEATKRQLAASEEVASSKTDRIAQLASALDQAQRELHLTEAQRVTLMARLGMAETKQARRQQSVAEEWQQKVEQLTTDRDRTARERDQLRARIDALEQKLSMARPGRGSRSLAQSPPAASPGQQQRQVAVIVPGRAAPIIAAEPPPSNAGAEPSIPIATGRLAEVERVLASTGVDVKRLFADFGNPSGLGGPFVPVPRGGMPADDFSAVRLAALPGLAKALPIAAPMYNYRETSAFGEREDPFNGRSAFHPGVDMAAPYGTPIYATAAGVVTFAGWSGGYGKIVEINHGHGIVTRYGHLARYVVLVGERVAAGTQIGYEGSTGRSTGPHVIYEIDVNGEPQDPAKFMSLARLIPAAAVAAAR